MELLTSLVVLAAGALLGFGAIKILLSTTPPRDRRRRDPWIGL